LTARSNSKLSLRLIGAVLTLGLAARLLVLWAVFRQFSARWFFQRGTEMGLLAQSILQGKGLSSPFGGSTGPTAFITPGYPLFVAFVFKIFGSYTSASAIVIMGTNVALNLLTILLIMQLAMHLSNRRAAVLAGIFWAISPPLIWMPTIFWETNVSCFILVASVALALRLRRTPSNAEFIFVGACLAIAGLINPALLPALLAILCWVAYRFRRSRPYGLLYALLAMTVVFSPWPIRNARVFHKFIPLRSALGYDLWMANRPQSAGYIDDSLFPTFDPSELREYVRVGEVAYVAGKSAEATHSIGSHPAEFLSLTLRRFARFWTGSGTRGGSLLYPAHACISTFLGLIGLGYLARRRPEIACLCALPLLLFPLPYYITHAEFRYRLILDPLLTILAAYAVSSLRDWPENLQWKR
jgi:hypothetical protein